MQSNINTKYLYQHKFFAYILWLIWSLFCVRSGTVMPFGHVFKSFHMDNMWMTERGRYEIVKIENTRIVTDTSRAILKKVISTYKK